ISLPGDHYRCAGAAQLGQIAGGGHSDPQARPFPADDRTIIIRLQQRTLEAPPSGTSPVTRVSKLARLARVGKRPSLLEGRGVENVGAGRDQVRQRLSGTGPVNTGLRRGAWCNAHRVYATSSPERW